MCDPLSRRCVLRVVVYDWSGGVAFMVFHCSSGPSCVSDRRGSPFSYFGIRFVLSFIASGFQMERSKGRVNNVTRTSSGGLYLGFGGKARKMVLSFQGQLLSLFGVWYGSSFFLLKLESYKFPTTFGQVPPE